MKTSKQMTKTIAVEQALPPCWVRVAETLPEHEEKIARGLLSAGPDGVLRDALIRLIDTAEQTVLLASFLFSDKRLCAALLAASERGVRVYMLTASGNKIQSRDDDDFSQRLIDEHEQLLNRLAGKVVLRSSAVFHAKFVVVDHQSRPQAWLSTANFNPALTQARELGVALDGESALAVAGWFCRMFWAHAEHELVEKNRLSAVSEAPQVPPEPRCDRIWVTTPTRADIRTRLLGWIRGSQREILVSSYGLEQEHVIVQALIERARAGVEVTVLTRPRPAVAAAVLALREAGAQIVAHDKLHAKALVCDHGALVMTANLAVHGLDDGFEVGHELSQAQGAKLRATLLRWASSFPWRFQAGATRADCLGEICLASEGLATGRREVVEQRSIDHGEVEAPDALELEAAPEPTLRPPDEGQVLPSRHVHRWRIVAPRLPPKAKPLKRRETVTETDKRGRARTREIEVDYDLPVFSYRKQHYVLLEDPAHARTARALAEELGAKVVIR